MSRQHTISVTSGYDATIPVQSHLVLTQHGPLSVKLDGGAFYLADAGAIGGCSDANGQRIIVNPVIRGYLSVI